MPASRKQPSPTAAKLASKIIDWFLANARDMPWRRTLDPYGIWVSEIMLQQTQVKTVIPYWNRWMKRLPTIAHLARATEPTILKLWEGLGYYTRVRNLQKAARQIGENHNGEFPTSPTDIIKLTGIGRYTAGAIASIAFDQPEPILDGNVIRVLSRFFAIEGDPKEKRTNETLWQLAHDLVRTAQCGRERERVDPPKELMLSGSRSALNQGLMELGATVCLPANPSCLICPLRSNCRALAEDRIENLPAIAKRAKTTKRNFITVVLRHGNRYLIRQRQGKVVNAGFWEFPNLESDASVKEVTNTLLGTRLDGKQIDRFEHSITRYRFRQTVFLVTLSAKTNLTTDGNWVTKSELQRRPFYSPQIRIFDRL